MMKMMVFDSGLCSKLTEARREYRRKGFFWTDNAPAGLSDGDLIAAVVEEGFTVKYNGDGTMAYVVEWEGGVR